MRKWFILFIIAVLPLAVSADEVKYGDLWFNTYEEDAATGTAAYAEVISSRDYSYSGDVTVPATMVDNNGVSYPVTSIGERAFQDSYNLTSVVISEGIQKVGICAFMSCSNLNRIEIPSSVTFIDLWAFSFCNNLVSVISKIDTPFEIDQSVFSIDNKEVEGTMVYTPSPAILCVPEGKTSAYQTYAGWNMFNEILEGELKEGSDGTFNYTYATGSKVATLVRGDYSSMSSVTIPATTTIDGVDCAVTSIGKEAFLECYNLESVTFSEGIKTIGHSAFQHCYNAAFSSLPSTIKVIDDNAFFDCHKIVNLVIPDGCTKIGRDAFNSCYNLKKVVLPNSLTSIGDYAFRNENITQVISHISSPFEIEQGVFCMTSNSYWDPEKQENINTYTKQNATLYVPDGTKSAYLAIAGWNMFVDIIEGEPKEITYEGLIYSYVDGKGIAKVIGRADEDLRDISILGSIPIGGNNYSVNAVGAKAFRSCGIETLVIGEGVETIGREAFRENWNLKQLVLPSTLKTIGEWAFSNCDNVKRIELPASLDSIGNYAFWSVDNLSTVISRIQRPFKISESVFALGDRWDNSGDTEKQIFTPSSATLYVPDGTKSSYDATEGWKGMFFDIIEGELKETTIDGLNYTYLDGKGTATVTGRANDELRTIKIPGVIHIGNMNYTVKAVGTGAFRGCYLDSLTIGDGVETIGRDAFRENWNLKQLVLPSTLKTIGEWAFSNCDNVKRIELPASLDSIGNYAFWSVDNLSTVISRIQRPFKISESVFALGDRWDNSGDTEKQIFTPSSATLYVPDGTKSSYDATEGWKGMFFDIIEGELKETTIDGLNYTYLDGKGTATVTGRANDELRTIKIPGVIPIGNMNYTVKAVGAGAFKECYLDSLTIGEGVETIGRDAFRENWYLKEIVLPSTLKTIGEWAFSNCDNVKRIELPASLDSIGNYAFWSVDNLSTVISRIQHPFKISESVFALGDKWDYSGDTEKQIFTPSSANLYVPEGTKSLYQSTEGWNMFAGMYEGELKEAVIGSLKYAYLQSTKVATVVSGEYSELTEVEIPSSITIDNVVYQVKEIGTGAFRGFGNIQSFTFNGGLEKIDDNAFQWCYGAEFGPMPSTLMSIGSYAFCDCDRVQVFELPEGVLSIGNNAFESCSYLQKVILPNSLTSIGDRAFFDCGNLITVVSRIQAPFDIHQNVFGSLYESYWEGDTYIEHYNPSPATLCVPEGTMGKYKALQGWLMFSDFVEGELVEITSGDLSYIANSTKKEATVTKGENYDQLTNVTIPGSFVYDGVEYRVIAIGTRAFANTPITSVTIEDGVKSIGQEAFNSCYRLTQVNFPSTLTEILSDAFNSCSRITSLFIPASVTSISNWAFTWMNRLNTIQVAAENTVYDSRNNCNAIIETSTNTLIAGAKSTVIPADVVSIGDCAFSSREMSEISIPGSVKTIGNSAFNSCQYLTEVILPEGVETLQDNAFRNCERLITIEFPTTLKNFGGWIVGGCNNLVNVVSNIEDPKEIMESVFDDNYGLYSRATLWVPKGKINTYRGVEGWNRFENYDELLGDILTPPTISYDGRRMVMTVPAEQKASIYYSVDGTKPNILYNDTILVSNLGTVLAIAKRFGSYTVDTTRYEITYVFDGVTAKTATGGLLSKAIEWCGADKVEMLDLDGILNDEDFGTVRSFTKLKTLNMAASTMDNNSIPAEAFANMKMQWFVSPYTMASVGSNIFKGCDQLTAIHWNSSSVELPEDVVTDVANPNMLVYAKALAMIPYALKNVVINGVANSIVLVDSTGNSDFVCPEQFTARRISYTHNYVQQTSLDGETQGWETLALPFTVSKITHETKGVITPSAVDGAERPFWLYELGDDGLKAAKQIVANVPYLICMPNNEGYGDEYILGGRVTFSAQNATVTTSGGIIVSSSDRQFVPTYKRVPASADVYAMNVNEVVGGNRIGSAFISNLREVRPFEAYSVHSGSRSRTIPVSSLGGGNATGINDLMLKNGGESLDGVVKVYSLSGALIKQGKREEVLRSLPKGLYIIDGKKIIK